MPNVWVRASKYTPKDPCRVLERRHGLADLVECGVGVRTGRAAVASYTGKQLADGARSTFIPLPNDGLCERLNPSPLRPIALDCVYYSGRAPMDAM